MGARANPECRRVLQTRTEQLLLTALGESPRPLSVAQLMVALNSKNEDGLRRAIAGLEASATLRRVGEERPFSWVLRR
jgi:hypothetical protein